MAAQKILAPLKKIPHQVQNLPIFKKVYDAKHAKAREMFGCHLSSTFGYPEQPSAFAYDPTLKVLAIGTHRGELKILGAPGVEFNAVHSNNDEVCRIVFIPNEGRLITLTGDNKLHFWEFDDDPKGAVWTELKILDLGDKGREGSRVTALALSRDAETLFIGTESGLLQKVAVKEWKLDDVSLATDKIAAGAAEDKRSGLKFGELMAVDVHPTSNHLLLGYSEGLVAVLDVATSTATHFCASEHKLESAIWTASGDQIVVSYCDGSYLPWAIDMAAGGILTNSNPPNTPYGPFPCKAINKVLMTESNKGNLTIFSGGMPKATYGDRHTVSVVADAEHVCFDFTSQVIDFVVIPSVPATLENGTTEGEEAPPASPAVASALLVMLEHEMVAVDLTTDKWPLLDLPYLSCINTACITALGHAEKVCAELMTQLSGTQTKSDLSTQPWPVTGGQIHAQEVPSVADILLTGHDDGTVSFWTLSSGDVFSKLTTVHTSILYQTDDANTNDKSGDDEAWPPFRRVGHFATNGATAGDDARYAVSRVQLVDGALVVGGMAGQTSVWRFSGEEAQVEPDISKVVADVIEDKTKFVWKGGEALKVFEGSRQMSAGFHPEVVVQVEPPSEVTAVSYQPLWEILAVGTAHGFVVVDTRQKKMVASRATVLDTHEIQPDSLMSKGKQIQKSLRQSFKRLRKMVPTPTKKTAPPAEAAEGEKKADEPGTSTDKPAEEAPKEGEEAAKKPEDAAAASEVAADVPAVTEEKKEETPAAPAKEEEKKEGEKKEESEVTGSGDAPAAVQEPPPEPMTLTSVDVTTALIRCLLFTETFVKSPHDRVGALIVGSQAGTAYIYVVCIPSAEERLTGEVKVTVAKELALQHAAPVVGIAVLDAKTRCPVTVGPLSTPEKAVATEEPKPAAPATDAPASDAPATDAPAASTETPAAVTAPQESKPPLPHSASVSGGMEHHELVICSEEQVKIFTLPHLKPKHKYKVLTDKSMSLGGTSGDAEAQAGTIDRSQLARTATIDRCALEGSSAARHRIKSFGVQQFHHQAKEEWNVVVALADALFYILSLPALKKQISGSFTQDNESFMAMTCVGVADANVVLTLTGSGQVRVTDVSQRSPSRYGAHCSLVLPEGVRPKREEPTTSLAAGVEAAASGAVDGAAEAVAEGLQTVQEGVEDKEPLEPVLEDNEAAAAEELAKDAALQKLAEETVDATIAEATKQADAELKAQDEAIDITARETVQKAIDGAKQELLSQTAESAAVVGESTPEQNGHQEVPVEAGDAVVDTSLPAEEALADAGAAASSEAATTVNTLTDKLNNTGLDEKSTSHIGDITMDSIKEYAINNDGVKMVKTEVKEMEKAGEKTVTTIKTDIEDGVTKVKTTVEECVTDKLGDLVKTTEHTEDSTPTATAGGD